MKSPAPEEAFPRESGSPVAGERPSPQPSIAPLPEPPGIPDHELIRRIGSGSYGEVWLARSALGACRAVKIVYRKSFEDSRPFEREFNGIQKFEPISRSHEGLVDILQAGRQEDYFYYVMELADGAERTNDECRNPKEARNPNDEASPAAQGLRASGFGFSSSFDIRHSDFYTPRTLRHDLKQRGRLPADECVRIGLALTSALAHLHKQGLVHRDIKPSNIIFVQGTPKLADIGLVTDSDTTLSYVGTEGFIPPEGPGAAQADIFSLGKVLYEISTGQDRRQFPDLPPDLKEWHDQAAVLEFNEVLLKACAREARLRYQSAEAMGADLALLQIGKSVKRRRAWEQRRAITKKIVVTGVLLTLLVTGAMSLVRHSQRADNLSSNREAAEFYQQAIYRLQKLTPDSFQPALADLNKAIQLDPRFVKAYLALFEAYKNAIAVWTESDWAHQNQSKIREIAGTLRNLSPDSAESHVVHSYVEWMAWHFDRAINEAEQAIKLDPDLARAHQLKGYYVLFSRGDVAKARQEYERASIGSADLVTQTELGHTDFFRRDFTNALAKYHEAARLEPANATAHLWIGKAYEANKQYEQALAEYEKWALLATGDSAEIKAAFKELKESLRTGGERAWHQKDFEHIQKKQPPDHYWLASLCVNLGRTNDVIPLLNKAYEAHNPRMTDLLFDEQWDGWREDPRFKQLLDKVGFPAVAHPHK